MKKPKVAFIHDYLVQYGGAEKTLEALLELYPGSDIFTGIYEPTHLSDFLNEQNIKGPRGGFFAKIQKFMTFLMPYVFENFDLTEYDLIISDGTAWPKGVLTTPEQLHISYIHTPPRFLYGYATSTPKRNAWYFKPFVSIIDFLIRIWDFYAAQRPDILLTNSKETQKRIKKFYRRDAKVIYPPVDVEVDPNIAETNTEIEYQNYYLMLGRLEAYKNFDFVITAFNKMQKNLVIIGIGAEEQRLKDLAGENIYFEGRASENRKNYLINNCEGLINPVKDEDLGIVPIEAMSHGKPVLAHKSGGHLETIKAGESGEFFDIYNQGKFIKEFQKFEENIKNQKYDAEKIRKSVEKFSKERFQQEMKEIIEKSWEDFQKRS